LAALLVLFAATITVSTVKIAKSRQEADEGVRTYAALAHSAVTVREQHKRPVQDTPPQGNTEKDLPQEEEQRIDVTTSSLIVDFDALHAINSGVVAWISSDTGQINYPVVKGTDNEYYLNHMVDGTANRNGAIFMDFRSASDLSDRNTFIYGHNMLNGAMFASLSRYSQSGYVQEHPELLLVIPGKSFSLQVFAGCVVPGNSDLYQLQFRDDAEFASYLERVRLISEFSTPVEVGASDRIVTLSTCAYDYEDARYVLFCKLVPMQ